MKYLDAKTETWIHLTDVPGAYFSLDYKTSLNKTSFNLLNENRYEAGKAVFFEIGDVGKQQLLMETPPSVPLDDPPDTAEAQRLMDAALAERRADRAEGDGRAGRHDADEGEHVLVHEAVPSRVGVGFAEELGGGSSPPSSP